MSYALSNEYAESLLVHFRRAELLRGEAIGLNSIDLSNRQLCDLELLLNRGLYPLNGYLSQANYQSVIEEMRLEDGTIWPLPICLDVSANVAKRLELGQRIALNDQEGFLLAILTVESLWQPNKAHEAELVYGAKNPGLHPGVEFLLNKTGEWYVGGQVEGLSLPLHYDFPDLRVTPGETHRRFTKFGWRRVLGFHTRDYLHCAHREMLLAMARDINANIFIHPVVELEHPGDREHFTHVHCYQEFYKQFPANKIFLGIMSLADRNAGPREALWHAIIRKNFGCSHFVVTKDHGDPFAQSMRPLFYSLGAAQLLVADKGEEIGIEMVQERPMGYDEHKAKYVFLQSAGEDASAKTIDSHELKRCLEMGAEIPAWFSFENVIKELRCAFPPRSKQGFTVFLTGLSGSGKSTIARVLMVRFMEMNTRPVTLLDGDIVRKNLSSELNFTEEHRNLNVTRIGFVASEITKNGGIAICAPIAPYETSRAANRELISRYGGYIEVYVATPLEVCEQRDRKGLYAKARKGLIKGVTGVSDPYIEPVNPELVLDTTDMTPAESVQEILLYLEEQGYV